MREIEELEREKGAGATADPVGRGDTLFSDCARAREESAERAGEAGMEDSVPSGRGGKGLTGRVGC